MGLVKNFRCVRLVVWRARRNVKCLDLTLLSYDSQPSIARYCVLRLATKYRTVLQNALILRGLPGRQSYSLINVAISATNSAGSGLTSVGGTGVRSDLTSSARADRGGTGIFQITLQSFSRYSAARISLSRRCSVANALSLFFASPIARTTSRWLIPKRKTQLSRFK